ncbi:unnamed protein product [Rotaria sp. Silwood2]|nr:unnamed protein product [Rotaria sp. Silwood2]CAF3093071.1 unnamed protein product [Rotaria sp. Silwood2]CAF3418574.1 unnamed protein product [Rotaria sp. Silwood2]CAF4016984.1 unnamed protein product [Rotaria sp. Silwood2]CAF4489516.1 unnamed protein product [Rotaria sp. Silwood2]
MAVQCKLLFKSSKKNDCHWTWCDRTCVDIYTYCLLNQAKAVPSNLPTIILEQSHQTSVAVILDRPRHLIEQHLKKRMSSPKISLSFTLCSRLLLYIDLPVRASIAALKLVERWYLNLKIPVIKISQIDHQLDHDPMTGDIQWNKHSIETLFKHIEQVIQQREFPSSTIDDLFIPWQTERNLRLYR